MHPSNDVFTRNRVSFTTLIQENGAGNERAEEGGDYELVLFISRPTFQRAR
jgi:hypothetical protein